MTDQNQGATRRRKLFKLTQAIGVVAVIIAAILFFKGLTMNDSPDTGAAMMRAGLWIGGAGLVAYVAGRFAVWWTAD